MLDIELINSDNEKIKLYYELKGYKNELDILLIRINECLIIKRLLNGNYDIKNENVINV